MRTIDELAERIGALEAKADALTATLATKNAQFADLQSGATLSPPVQARIDELFDRSNAVAEKLDAVITANAT